MHTPDVRAGARALQGDASGVLRSDQVPLIPLSRKTAPTRDSHFLDNRFAAQALSLVTVPSARSATPKIATTRGSRRPRLERARRGISEPSYPALRAHRS